MGGRPRMLASLILVATLYGRQVQSQVSGPSAPFAGFKILPLAPGANNIDLNADGQPDLVFLAWQDNGTAPGYDVITFFLSDTAVSGRWLLLPLVDRQLGDSRAYFHSVYGPSCAEGDYLRMQPKTADLLVLRRDSSGGGPIQLLVGRHKYAHNPDGIGPVIFTVYQYTVDTAVRHGQSPYYFRAVRTIQGRQSYCDIRDAFAEEFGLGRGTRLRLPRPN